MSFPGDMTRMLNACGSLWGRERTEVLYEGIDKLEKLLKLLDEIDTKPIIVAENMRA